MELWKIWMTSSALAVLIDLLLFLAKKYSAVHAVSPEWLSTILTPLSVVAVIVSIIAFVLNLFFFSIFVILKIEDRRARNIVMQITGEVVKSQASNSLEHRAYREAGHTVMSYLILKGFADKYIPISREEILPEFKQVTIEGEGVDWSEITSNLGSLLTVPQVLLAGYVAKRVKYNNVEDTSFRNSTLIKRALNLLSGYLEEYYETGDFRERQKLKTNFLKDVYTYVEEHMRIHWISVEKLASALLDQKTLSQEKAFEIIEGNIPEDLKMKAKVELSQTANEKLAEILKAANNLS